MRSLRVRTGDISDLSATLTLMACGYTPNEVAAAGVGPSEIQSAIALLNTEGVPLRFDQATAAYNLAARSLTAARESYLRTRSLEDGLALETATTAERAAHQNVMSLREEVDEYFTEITSARTVSMIRRCEATSGLGLPTRCRFIDPETVRPDEIARAAHRMGRAARNRQAADPVDTQLIQLVEGHADVQNAATNLSTYGAAVRSIYDSHMQE